jgi:hypothetical protein
MATYQAAATCQITEVGDATSSLVVHELHAGGPLCNQPVRPWKGKPMQVTPQGPGTVTCGHCARSAGHA